MMFPVIGTCFLLGMYFGITYFGKDIVTFCICIHMMLVGGLCVKNMIEGFLA